MEHRFDLIVIGAGPGGYVAAIKAAKLGMKVAIVENREIGGTCLNRGCIPTKTLMHSSHLYYEVSGLQDIGVHINEVSFDLNQIQDHKETVVNKMRQGIVALLEANQVTVYYGTAVIQTKGMLLLKTVEGEIELHAEQLLIATGAKPAVPEIEGIHCQNVITSDEFLSQRNLYQKLLIIGGGVIGIECATIYRELGREVEIIEAMDRILPQMDKEISQSISMNLKKKGINIHTKAKVVKIAESDGILCCEYIEKEAQKTAKADGILVAIGRRANTQGLFGPGMAVEMEGAHIMVTSDFETNIPGIYAIGDVIKGKQLAHAASAQGIVAVEKMCHRKPSVALSAIPSCIYTVPEAASVGLTEEEALAEGYTVKVGKYPMLGNGKTILSKGERGFVKVVCDAATDKILGAQLLCERATDMISEISSAIVHGLTHQELASVVRPHPTYNEAFTEALEEVEQLAIHLMPKRNR